MSLLVTFGVSSWVLGGFWVWHSMVELSLLKYIWLSIPGPVVCCSLKGSSIPEALHLKALNGSLLPKPRSYPPMVGNVEAFTTTSTPHDNHIAT